MNMSPIRSLRPAGKDPESKPLTLCKHPLRLSIIIPNYNYAHYLAQAVSSVFQGKTKNDFEILIVNDASTDNSLDVIAHLQQQFPSIRVFNHEKNLGCVQAVATGVKHSRGHYLHFLSADDLYHPFAVDRMFEYFDKFPFISIFSSDDSYFYNSDINFQKKRMLQTEAFHFFSQKQLSTLFRHTDFWMPGHTVFMKKAVFENYGPLDQSLGSVCDWYLNHKIALKEGLGYIPEALIAMRKHPGSYFSFASKEKRRQVWQYLLQLLENGDAPASLRKSGVMRMMGLRAIYKDLIRNPKYWKYLFPMCRKEIEKRGASLVHFDRERYWLKRIYG